MEKKIDRFEFANLRQFKGKYKITFDDRLNLITGNNGSGKSTVIEGINAVLGNEIDNAESLINKSKIAAHIKVIFDDDTSVMLKLLKEDNKIRKMYFINNRYTTQEEVSEYTNDLNIEIIDNYGVTLDKDELTKAIRDLKAVNKQIILAIIRDEVLTVADKIINVEELKQCQIV